MTGNEIFGIIRNNFHQNNEKNNFIDDYDIFTLLPDSPEKKTLFCGIKKATANIDNIPEYLSFIKKIADEYDAYVICLNEENIAGYEHIESAVFHAKRSWFEEKPISNSFEMEVLVYAAGTRQCSKATSFGLKKGENSLYICVCIIRTDNFESEEKNGKIKSIIEIFEKLNDFFEFTQNSRNKNEKIPDEKIKKLMKIFDIPKKEIESVGTDRISELVLERVALLDVFK